MPPKKPNKATNSKKDKVKPTRMSQVQTTRVNVRVAGGPGGPGGGVEREEGPEAARI